MKRLDLSDGDHKTLRVVLSLAAKREAQVNDDVGQVERNVREIHRIADLVDAAQEVEAKEQ